MSACINQNTAVVCQHLSYIFGLPRQLKKTFQKRAHYLVSGLREPTQVTFACLFRQPLCFNPFWACP